MSLKLRQILNHVYVKVIIVMFALVLPLNLISILQNNGSIQALLEQARLTTKNMADNYMNEINARMKNTQSILVHFLQEDVDCIRMREQGEDAYVYKSAKMRFYYNLKTIGSLINGADGYFYYMKKKEDMLIWGKSTAGGDIIRYMDQFVPGQLADDGKKGWHIYEFEGKEYLVLLIERNNIAYGGWLNLNDISVQIKKGIDYQEYSISYLEEKEGIEIDGQLAVISEKKGIILQILIPEHEVTGRISGYQKILQYMVFVYLLLIPLLYFFLRYLLFNPLGKVNDAHRQLQKGNQDYRIRERANSIEYQEVFASFNQMADNLTKLRIEGYEKEIARQKIELRNLQLQIRPHFLLNTFNLIFTLIQRREYDSIEDVVLYLSAYFRYIFRSHKELELFPKEWKMIRDYVKMASKHYFKRIALDCQVDPEIDFVRVPPLLLHNFVENSIKYGIKKNQELQITMVGEYENGVVTFYIMDNGNGIEEETLLKNQRILSGEAEPENPSTHIGLLNSMKRLKYFYGEEASIEIESEQGKMTCFKIQFPYDMEDFDESFDCE